MDISRRPLATDVTGSGQRREREGRAGQRRAGPTDAEVRAALNTVVDPCSVVAGAPAGLVDMGLVRSVGIVETPDGCDVAVTIGVTEPTCLMGVVFLRDADEVVRSLPGVRSVHVLIDHALRYDALMQTPEYAARLRAARIARGITIGVRS